MQEQNIGRIIAVHRGRYCLYSETYGECYAQLKSSSYYLDCIEEYPTAGDMVEFIYNPYGDCLITHTLPRKSYFSRFDSFAPGNEQAIAANFDIVFILTSANHDFNIKRLHRYLAAARSSKANYAIVITKADLTDDLDDYIRQASEAASEDCLIHAISAATGRGLEAIQGYLKPGTMAVFLGSSGVGKSTLVNALAGRFVMDVNGIRENDSKGRHTTTRRQIIALDNGALVLDTPGMRELGLIDAEEGLKETFVDIDALTACCKFSNCTHQNEPGCAIRQAIESGQLTNDRLEEYLKLQKEAQRHSVKGREEITKRQKAISKFSRELKKGKGKNGF